VKWRDSEIVETSPEDGTELRSEIRQKFVIDEELKRGVLKKQYRAK
jgi:hypothetical protein